MTLTQYEAKTRALRGALTKAKNAAKGGGMTLAQKLELQKAAKARQSDLDQHLLGRFELVTE